MRLRIGPPLWDNDVADNVQRLAGIVDPKLRSRLILGELLMARRQSVAFCLMDAGFLSDPKFRRLARRLTDPDAFNSAVGAYVIALASSRRNGSPEIDVAHETESSYLEDLRACELLTDDGFPEKPWHAWGPYSQQAEAGRARASSALREGGKFLPAEPAYASATSALAVAGETDQRTPADTSGAQRHSTPLSSNQLLYVEGGVGGEEELDGRVDLEAWLMVKRRPPTSRQREFMDAYCQTFDVTGPARAERLILSHPDDPIAALKEDLDEFRKARLQALPARDEIAEERAAIASRRRDEQMWKRRLETYQWTGEWHEELGWGPAPERKAPA